MYLFWIHAMVSGNLPRILLAQRRPERAIAVALRQLKDSIKALGRSHMDSQNPYTNSGTFINSSLGAVTTYTKLASGTPWTTGTVTVYATEGSFTTSLQRSGYDTTTPGGVRKIQLVTPALTHWKRGHGRPFNHTGHIAIINIQLVPEPSNLAMFAAGAGALLLLYGAHHGSSSRRDFGA